MLYYLETDFTKKNNQTETQPTSPVSQKCIKEEKKKKEVKKMKSLLYLDSKFNHICKL